MELDSTEVDSSEWLFGILQQVQLEQFYVRIRDHLQISRLSHFDYVTPEDLEKVDIYAQFTTCMAEGHLSRTLKFAKCF